MSSITSARHFAKRRKDIIVLLVVKDDALSTAKIIRQSFSGIAVVATMISNASSVGVLLEEYTFNMVFLQMSSSPTATELEAVKTIRLNKKKNQNLLFSSIIPENFQDCISGHKADIILCEPLTPEKLKIVVDCWKSTFSSLDENGNLPVGGPSGVPLSLNAHKRTYDDTDTALSISSNLLGKRAAAWSASTTSNSENKISYHSSKEKIRRERIKKCCDQLRLLLPHIHGTKTDIASVLEATVNYMRNIQDKIPSAVTTQIVKILQSNRRFCTGQQVHMELSSQSCVVAQRNTSHVKSLSPWKRTRFRTDKYTNTLLSGPSDLGKETWTAADSDVVKYLKNDTHAIPSENMVSRSFKNPTVKPLTIPSFSSVSATQPVYLCPSVEVTAISAKNFSTVSSSSVPATSIFPCCYDHPALAQIFTVFNGDTTGDINRTYLQQDRLCTRAATAEWLNCKGLQFPKSLHATFPAVSSQRTDLKESCNILLFWSGPLLSEEWPLCQGITEGHKLYQTSASHDLHHDIPDPKLFKKSQCK